MIFTEANTVEQMVLDTCVSLGWRFVPDPTLPRQSSNVFVGQFNSRNEMMNNVTQQIISPEAEFER